MPSNLDPWNVIGWLLLAGLVLALLAVLVFVLLFLYSLQEARLKNWRAWRKTRQVLPPETPGQSQAWGWKHGPKRGTIVELRRNANGTLRFDFSTQVCWGGQSDADWFNLRNKNRYTLMS